MKKEMKTICCVCLKTKGEDGWERLVVESLNEVSHGYCPMCYWKAMRRIEEANHKLTVSSINGRDQ